MTVVSPRVPRAVPGVTAAGVVVGMLLLPHSKELETLVKVLVCKVPEGVVAPLLEVINRTTPNLMV